MTPKGCYFFTNALKDGTSWKFSWLPHPCDV
nr:MAG TPA: hypothetical protein [Caudoviricetes sp.]